MAGTMIQKLTFTGYRRSGLGKCLQRILLLVFYVLGLDIYPTRRTRARRVIVCICKKITVSVWFVAVVDGFFLACSISRENYKRVTSTLAFELIVIAVWINVLMFRNRISTVMRMTSNLKLFSGYPGVSKRFFLCTVAFNLFVIIGVSERTYSSLGNPRVESFCYLKASLGEMGRVLLKIQLVLRAFYPFYVFAMQYAFLNFYIFVCHQLTAILRRYVKSTEDKARSNRIHFSSLKDTFRDYEEILAAIAKFESVMSFGIFCVFVNLYVGIILGALATKTKSYASGLYRLLTVAFPTLSVIAEASKLNDCDKLAKDVNLEILETAQKLNIFADDGTFRRLSKRPPFMLTGWGMFGFSWNLVLAVAGSIITYTLLIIGI